MPSAGWRIRNEPGREPGFPTRSTEEVKAVPRPDDMAENTIKATDQTFGDLIAGQKPVLVDFWAEWCGPCKMIAPTLEDIAGEYADKITIAKLNVDENPQTAMSYDVMSIPTLIVYQGGEEKKRIVGARPKMALLQDLNEFLG
jgi:thioredoxin 1